MSAKPYSNVCSISKACQILEPRWTLPILNQLWNGYSRFNDIRRAVGGVYPHQARRPAVVFLVVQVLQCVFHGHP